MLPSSTEIIVGALQRFMQSAGQAFHGQSFVNGSIAAAWRLAISDADWLVHSLNRGLSATVSDRCGRTPCFVFSKSPLVDSTEWLPGASRNLPFCSFPAKGSNRNNRRSVHFKHLAMVASSGGKSLSEKGSARTSCTVLAVSLVQRVHDLSPKQTCA
jgi:hypothetical protein